MLLYLGKHGDGINVIYSMVYSTIVRLLAITLLLSVSSAPAIASGNLPKCTSFSDSVYRVYAVKKDKRTVKAAGNCVAISKNMAVTNCHVALAGNFTVIKVDGKPYLARICYTDQDNDFCILESPEKNLNPVRIIRPTKSTKPEESVYCVAEFEKEGKVKAKGKITNVLFEGEKMLIQTNAELKKGASGGGIFDKDGCLIGITTFMSPHTGLGYAIPTELIFQAIDPNKLPVCKKHK